MVSESSIPETSKLNPSADNQSTLSGISSQEKLASFGATFKSSPQVPKARMVGKQRKSAKRHSPTTSTRVGIVVTKSVHQQISQVAAKKRQHTTESLSFEGSKLPAKKKPRTFADKALKQQKEESNERGAYSIPHGVEAIKAIEGM